MDSKPNIGIVPFTYFGGYRKPVGSTFLRVEGLIENSDSFSIWKHGRPYDCLIFQKAYWVEMIKVYRGPKILDLCDLDWVTGNVNIIDIGNAVDAITCSSPKLTKLLSGYFPSKIVEHVPDRLNFKIFPRPKSPHVGIATNVVWFGFIPNAYRTLRPMAKVLALYNLKLTIIADKPYEQVDEISRLDIRFIKYDPKDAYDHIQYADIVLNPKSKIGGYKYKSNNKSITAWKLGIPVAETPEDIVRLLNPNVRNSEVSEKLKIVEAEYNVEISGSQYLNIYQKIISI